MKTQLLLGLWATAAMAQGPLLSYLRDPATELSFAECHVYLDGGSRHKIPFLPVVNAKGAPCGTERYTKDIRLKAPIVFVGNGAGAAYSDLDVKGKVVMLSYDFPDSATVSLEDRVREAVSRGAAAVMLFSVRLENPFPTFKDDSAERIPEIPVITIAKRDAATIFASAGLDPEQLFRTWETEGKVRSEVLISKLDLRIDARFDSIETEGFSFAFEPRGINRGAAERLAETTEKALQFNMDLFREAQPQWRKTFVVYYAGFDSKLFLLHHRGSGLSSDAGAFMVYDGRAPDFGLAVHENAHSLIRHTWGGSSSFLDEGIGKYAEAMATDKAKNHRETAANMRAGKLFPLEEMVKINIGSDPRTDVAYPAAGSFVQWLIDKYSLAKLKVVYKGGVWTTAYGRALPELERDWLEFLKGR